MTIKLPHPISRYFETDRTKDANAIAHCFTGAAVVRDERNTYVGRDSIRQWKEQTSKKYTYTVEPFSLLVDKGRIVVTARLTGSFPGSPTDLRYFFVLDDDKIAELEITP
jgi:SnoaL-like domain